MRDDDELCLRAHFGQHFVEAAHVGFVERCVNFVENAEWARLITKYCDQQRERRERFFAPGEQQDILQALARRLGDDVDSHFA